MTTTEIVTTDWQDCTECLPNTPRVVLATDSETHYLAIYEHGTWVEAATSDEIDYHITHWMELPELPNA